MPSWKKQAEEIDYYSLSPEEQRVAKEEYWNNVLIKQKSIRRLTPERREVVRSLFMHVSGQPSPVLEAASEEVPRIPEQEKNTFAYLDRVYGAEKTPQAVMDPYFTRMSTEWQKHYLADHAPRFGDLEEDQQLRILDKIKAKRDFIESASGPKLSAERPPPELEKQRGIVPDIGASIVSGTIKTVLGGGFSAARAVANRFTHDAYTGPGRMIRPHWTDPEFWNDMSEKSKALRRTGDLRLQKPFVKRALDPHWWARNVFESLPQLIGSGVAYSQAGPYAAFAFMATLEGGSAYQEFLDKGMPEQEALLRASAVGLGNGMLEFIPVERLFKNLPVMKAAKKGLIRKFASVLTKGVKQGALEGVTEGLQEEWQMFVEGVGYEPTEKEKHDWDRTLKASALGFVMGLGVGVAGDIAVEAKYELQTMREATQTAQTAMSAIDATGALIPSHERLSVAAHKRLSRLWEEAGIPEMAQLERDELARKQEALSEPVEGDVLLGTAKMTPSVKKYAQQQASMRDVTIDLDDLQAEVGDRYLTMDDIDNNLALKAVKKREVSIPKQPTRIVDQESLQKVGGAIASGMGVQSDVNFVWEGSASEAEAMADTSGEEVTVRVKGGEFQTEIKKRMVEALADVLYEESTTSEMKELSKVETNDILWETRRIEEAPSLEIVEKDVPIGTPEARKRMLALADSEMGFVEKGLRKVWNNLDPTTKRILRGVGARPLTSHPAIQARHSAYKGFKARQQAAVVDVLEMLSTNKTTPAEKIILDLVLRGEESPNLLPEHLRPKTIQATETLREKIQEAGRLADFIGLKMREDWVGGPRSWFPRLYYHHEQATWVGGKLFATAKQLMRVSKKEASHTKRRVSDKYAVYKDGKMTGAYDTRPEAEKAANKLLMADAEAGVDIVNPKRASMLIGQRLVTDYSYNIRRGVSANLALAAKTGFIASLTDPAMVEEGLFSLEPGPGLVATESTGLLKYVHKSAIKPDSKLAQFRDGYIDQDIAMDLAAMYGPRGVFSKWLGKLGETAVRSLRTYLEPMRHVKQFFENWFTLALADSRAVVSPKFEIKNAQWQLLLHSKQTPEPGTERARIWKELEDLGVPEETYVMHLTEPGQVSTEMVEDIEGPTEGSILQAIAEHARQLNQNIKEQYGATDLAFKASLYEYYRLDRGYGVQKAFTEMEAGTFNFRDLPLLIQKLSFIPFLPSVSSNFSRIIGRQLVKHPGRFMLKIGAAGVGWAMLRGAMMDKFGIDDETQKKMGDRALGWFEIPIYRNSKGQTITIDFTWLIAFSEFKYILPSLPEDTPRTAISLSPMIAQGAVAAVMGKTGFGAEGTRESEADRFQRWLDWAGTVGKGLTPGWAGGQWRRVLDNARKREKDKKPVWTLFTGGLFKVKNVNSIINSEKSYWLSQYIQARNELESISRRNMTVKQKKKAMRRARKRLAELRKDYEKRKLGPSFDEMKRRLELLKEKGLF